MARRGSDPPVWARDEDVYLVRPVDVRFDPTATERYLIACTIGGRNRVFNIRWRAASPAHAEKTFREWLDGGWAVMDHTFHGVPCERYVFRTGAINGFHVLSE